MLGEIVDRIAAVAQLANSPVDERAWRSIEIDALQSPVNLDRLVCFGHSWPHSPALPLALARRSRLLEINMDPVERCLDIARRGHFKVVLPEGDDIRVLAAARSLIDREIAQPIVLGAPDVLTKSAVATGIDLHGIEIIDPRSDARTQAYGVARASRRENMSLGMGIRLAAKPLYFAGMMVRQGDAQAMV